MDPRTGEQQTWATELVGPNGLALLRDGIAIVTRASLDAAGVASAVTRVPAHDRTNLERFWSDLTSTNGAAVDRSGRWLYVSRSISERAEVWRLSTRDPSRRERVADLGEGPSVFLDDLTVGPDGKVYVAAWGAGEVHRIHPSTGRTCRIATDLTQVTAVEAVPARNLPAPHFRLYATTALGDLFELTPST